jgi:SAM-dependent methyltransferase
VYRFMDVIYLPVRPYRLDPSAVKELCELRLRMLPSISDELLRSRVALTLAKVVRLLSSPAPMIIDFGTGSAKMLDILRPDWSDARLCGVDMSLASLASAPSWAAVVLAAPEGPLPVKTGSVDIITALFVFHFRLPDVVRQELRRILRKPGFLIGNIYGEDTASYELDMTAVGWKLCQSTAVAGASGHRIDAWHSNDVPCPRLADACGAEGGPI